MVTLQIYNPTHYSKLHAYQLPQNQAQFTSSIYDCVHTRKDTQDPCKTIVTVLYDNTAVGFFVLDTGVIVNQLTNNSNAIAVRSFSVNPEYQGNGIGTQAMQLIPQFIHKHFAHINEVVLSVNCKNSKAYKVYINANYSDTQKTINGPMGPQHVLSKKIEK